MEKGQCFQQMVLGKVDTYLQKNEVRPYTININKKMNQRPIRPKTLKDLEEILLMNTNQAWGLNGIPIAGERK